MSDQQPPLEMRNIPVNFLEYNVSFEGTAGLDAEQTDNFRVAPCDTEVLAATYFIRSTYPVWGIGDHLYGHAPPAGEPRQVILSW